jgi:hypothetical protein
MRIAAIFLLTAFAFQYCSGQESAKNPPAAETSAAAKEKPAPNLSEDFSKAALKTILVIRHLEYEYPLRSLDRMRFEQAQDDAEMAANTPAEKKAMDWLHGFALDNETIGLMIQKLTIEEATKYMVDPSHKGETTYGPEIETAMDHRDDCGKALEAILRSRIAPKEMPLICTAKNSCSKKPDASAK